jgi:hypothetical protein
VLVKTGETARNDAPVVFDVLVWMNGHPAAKAVVLAGSNGKLAPCTQTSPGHFFAEDAGYQPFYDISVEADGAKLDAVRLRAPSNATLAVAHVARRGAQSEVAWHPALDPTVDDVHVRVVSWEDARTTFASDPLADVGHFAVPAEAFPAAGSFAVGLLRASSLMLSSSPDSVGIVQIDATADVVAR